MGTLNDNNQKHLPRYFLLEFSGLTEDNVLRSGKIEFSTLDGKFINEAFIIRLITKNFKLKEVYIRSVNEMGEKDFMEWTEFRKEDDDLPPSSDVGFL